MGAGGAGGGAPTIRELADARAREEKDGVASDPTVRLLLATFPGAEIVAGRSLVDPAPAVPAAAASGADAANGDVGYGHLGDADPDSADDGRFDDDGLFAGDDL